MSNGFFRKMHPPYAKRHFSSGADLYRGSEGIVLRLHFSHLIIAFFAITSSFKKIKAESFPSLGLDFDKFYLQK